MNKTPTPDEQPKRKVARRVVAEKRQYFVPVHGQVVEATSAQRAAAVAKAIDAKKQKDGDA